MKNLFFLLPCIAFFLLFQQTAVYAQSAKLGIQGILKKANGNAVDDGTYSLTFKIYNVLTGGTALWTETQSNIEVASGIYTATLGAVTALNIPFNETYYLGVTVGATTEMAPRIQLTTAPYALSLIGNTNQFPSSGTVKADNEIIAGKLAVGQTTLPTTQSLQVTGGILARGGAPGGSGASNNGYAFSGNSGDTDSGMFSTADGNVSLYSNNVEVLRVTGGGSGANANIKGNATVDNSLTVTDQLSVNGRVSTNLTMNNGKGLAYYNGSSTLNAWRLVDLDDFVAGGGNEGWQGTTTLASSTNAVLENVGAYGAFNGYVLRPTTNNAVVMKKQFNLAGVGPYNYVKIVFKYYFTDSWDYNNDVGIAGFSTSLGDPNPVICWSQSNVTYSTQGTASYTGSTTWSDAATTGQMVATTSATSFYVFFGMRSDEGGLDNERYAVSNIEVWVR